MPSTAVASGWSPGSLLDDVRDHRGGAPPRRPRRTSTRTRRTRGAGCAARRGRTRRRPRTRWCRRCRARSPSRRAARTGRRSPARTAPTTCLTGAWRCDVPITVVPGRDERLELLGAHLGRSAPEATVGRAAARLGMRQRSGGRQRVTVTACQAVSHRSERVALCHVDPNDGCPNAWPPSPSRRRWPSTPRPRRCRRRARTSSGSVPVSPTSRRRSTSSRPPSRPVATRRTTATRRPAGCPS